MLLAYMEGRKDLLNQILDTAASGYVGVRYGREVLLGSGALGKLINKTSMFGLLLEIRGGPVKGLRYYYDVLPRTSTSLPGINGPVDTTIQFSRHVVGFSWDIKMPFMVDKLTIDPKIGMWSFNATLPVTSDSQGRVAQVGDFNLGRTFSLGLDIGLEELADWYTVREWYGVNTGYSIIKSGAKVTSNRFGVDAYFTGGPDLPIFGVTFKSAILAFFFYESVDLTRNVTAAENGPATITGVSYKAGYAGLGLALSW
jgi:hypothetical protein